MKFVLHALSPGMLQAMLVIAAWMMKPLERRPGSTIRIVLGLVLGFAFGGYLSLIDGRYTNVSPHVFYLVEDLLILLITFFYFSICTRLNGIECLYAISNVYIVQHGVVCAFLILKVSLLSGTPTTVANMCGWMLYLLLGGGLVYLFNRCIPAGGHYRVSAELTIIMLLIVLALTIGFPMLVGRIAEHWEIFVVCEAYGAFSCALVFALQVSLRRENKLLASLTAERRVRQKMKEQYELSKENIQLINQKCHDLRHQISGLRFVKDEASRNDVLREIEQSVMIYDAAVKTGNEVLDTLLTEKSLICAKNRIYWSCMADGAELQFISPVDLYTVLGNALDNAIESCMKLEEERRIIRVVVRHVAGGCFIQISNYYDSVISTSDGRLQTTKKDKESHGFGIASIRRIVQQYGGEVTVETNNGIFVLSILFPIVEKP